jgi:hypothetical protein
VSAASALPIPRSSVGALRGGATFMSPAPPRGALVERAPGQQVDADADVRARAAEVRASRGRLLVAADGERRALSERLDRGPVAQLRRVRRVIERRDAALGAELDAAMNELAALGRGLYPPSVALRRLPEALR